MKKYITTIACAACMNTISAQSVNFSFITDTWNYASGSPTTGFATQVGELESVQSSGSVTKSGLTMKFGASFVGGANSGENFGTSSSGRSMTNSSASQNPAGFMFTSQDNDSTGLTNGIATSLTGSISSYQRWHFEFSAPVTINSFLIEDIDNLSGGGTFRDILGAEGFLSAGYSTAFSGNALNVSSLPVAGSGSNPTWGFGSPTELQTYDLTLGAGGLQVVSPNTDTGNLSSNPKHSVNISFGSTPITAFSIYSISNHDNVHRMALDNSSFQVTIPEPSATMLALVSVVGLLQRRRRL
jgi:hypothetical protein